MSLRPNSDENQLHKALTMKHPITSKKAYHETMVAVYDLMNKGEDKLTRNELKKLESMAIAAEEYEDTVLISLEK
jgi:HTH-type transcriptional regulator/antitoxin HigA